MTVKVTKTTVYYKPVIAVRENGKTVYYMVQANNNEQFNAAPSKDSKVKYIKVDPQGTKGRSLDYRTKKNFESYQEIDQISFLQRLKQFFHISKGGLNEVINHMKGMGMKVHTLREMEIFMQQHPELFEKISTFAKQLNPTQYETESRNQGNGAVAQQRRQTTNGGLLADAQARIQRGDGDVLSSSRQRIQSEEEIDRRNREDEEAIEKLAKEQGKWINEVDQHLEQMYGQHMRQGAESYVYRKDGKTVIKSRSLIGYNTIREALESIEIHNLLFPETAMNVVAFGRSDGEFTAVLEQTLIEGNFATKEEIEQFVKDRFGAERDNSVIGDTSYKTDKYLLQDLKSKNVIVQVVDGRKQLFVIDGDFYYAQQDKDVLPLQTPSGEVYGFVYQGEIYIDET